jgi:hypothetical protein
MRFLDESVVRGFRNAFKVLGVFDTYLHVGRHVGQASQEGVSLLETFRDEPDRARGGRCKNRFEAIHIDQFVIRIEPDRTKVVSEKSIPLVM